eukprot:TRINITY_DN4708_c0_g1_i1.p1 TRINITY_DN4708_c0_g1~~TRINITY_DN4708_c0_g1_i1.p1  ORF type:complete len:215 (-),score=59.53 TRINITY_DN4708_c0_g1_i1:47-691(-)
MATSSPSSPLEYSADHEVRDGLLSYLQSSVKLIIAECTAFGPQKDVTNRSDHVDVLLDAVVRVLGNGLSSPNFLLAGIAALNLTTLDPWSFLSEVSVFKPDLVNVVGWIEHEMEEDIDRTRAFIKHFLNNGGLVETISFLSRNASVIEDYYQEQAIMRREEETSRFLQILAGLQTLTFRLTITDEQAATVALDRRKPATRGVLTSTTPPPLHSS